MKIGMGLRNMGDVADRDTLTQFAKAAEAAGAFFSLCSAPGR